MRTLLMCMTLAVIGAVAQAQDPGMQAAQQAQMAAQIAQQASQQAMRDAQQASQQANQAMVNAQQQSMQNTQCYRCGAAMPKFSVKSGMYSSAVTVKIKDSGRGSAIYYTTDGWTPTATSTRYTGPITIDSTTTLQAIAISPYGGRSRVASAVYTLNGVVPAVQSVAAVPNATANARPAAASAKLLLARGTPVTFAFASDVSSKTADVGDKISLTLAEDLTAGGVVVVKKGTPSTATVTEVDKPRMLGVAGEVFFQVDSLQADGTVIRLRGGAAKEGQDKEVKAAALLAVPVVPVALFVHGKDAEINQGTTFTAYVDADTLLAPLN
jgi:chitobiase/beta-hexosaminidase-like protein